MTTSNLTQSIVDASSIQSRALLVWLSVRTWTARKYDRTITAKVNAQEHASKDAGRWNKFLLPGDAPEYHALLNRLQTIRLEHYQKTAAWSDEGWRILPTVAYMDYAAWFRQAKDDINQLLPAFVAAYPQLKMNARQLLNGGYKDEDYPSVQDIQSRFDLRLEYAPIPSTGDVRVALPQDQLVVIEQTISAHVKRSIDTVTTDLSTRLMSTVAKMHDRLATPDAIFRNSLIENIREVCDNLAVLNVTGDQHLERFRLDALRELATADPDTLREVPEVRADVAAKADAILKSMSAIYGGATV